MYGMSQATEKLRIFVRTRSVDEAMDEALRKLSNADLGSLAWWVAPSEAESLHVLSEHCT
jgi:hypothetical protein